MTTDKPTPELGIDFLRRAVKVLDSNNEGFNQRYTADELLRIVEVMTRCEWLFYPDQWSGPQVKAALQCAIAPRWDDQERPLPPPECWKDPHLYPVAKAYHGATQVTLRASNTVLKCATTADAALLAGLINRLTTTVSARAELTRTHHEGPRPMTLYRIQNRTSGADLGVYAAPSPEAALDELARTAGYRDAAEARAVGNTRYAELSVTPARCRIILDNAGGITLQLGEWAHWYAQGRETKAAEDIQAFLATGDTHGWEGHDDDAASLDPSADEIRNGGYRVVVTDSLADAIEELQQLEWGNAIDLAAALIREAQ